MYQTTRGLILRETEYKDYDKILTILTDSAGLVTARAWGVKRKNSPLRSGCQLLVYGEFTLQEKEGFCKVQEAVPLELFTPLRGDIERLSLASYFAQTAEVLAQEDLPDPQLPGLILHALRALCLGRPAALVKAAYELKLAFLAGYEPDFTACIVCGCDTPDRFDVSDGCLRCTRCRGEQLDSLLLPVSPGTLQALRYLASAPPAKLFSFTLGEASLRELSGIGEAYLLTRLERGFYTLDFYKSLLMT